MKDPWRIIYNIDRYAKARMALYQSEYEIEPDPDKRAILSARIEENERLRNRFLVEELKLGEADQ